MKEYRWIKVSDTRWRYTTTTLAGNKISTDMVFLDHRGYWVMKRPSQICYTSVETLGVLYKKLRELNYG